MVDYNLTNPMAGVMQGMAVGNSLQKIGTEKLDREAAAAKATQDAELAAEQTAALNADLSRMFDSGRDPTAADFAKMSLKYPQFNKEFAKTWDVLQPEQQEARTGQASDVYAALEAGKPDMAIDMLETQVEAATNSGNKGAARSANTMIELIKASPSTAKTSVGLRLASMMGPEKFGETFAKLQGERRKAELHESDMTKKESEAHSAAVSARYAESAAIADLDKNGWDIYKIQNDASVSRENARIAALRAQIAREALGLKRDEMERRLEGAEKARDQAARDVVARVESAEYNIDNMLSTLDKLLATPLNVIGDAAGPISSRLPTLDTDTANFEALIENVEAQAFLAQIPNIKGMGSLSDAEGRKLTAAFQNFSLKQGPNRLVANFKESQRLLLKARTNIASQYGQVPTIPDTPTGHEAQVTDDPGGIDALVNQILQGEQ